MRHFFISAGQERKMLSIARLVVGYVSTNCYIVCNEQEGSCVIVDPGDNAAGIIKTMKDRNTEPVAILLTHGHFDHILAVPELTGAYPDIQVYAYEAEKALLTDAGLNETRMIRKPMTLDSVRYLKDGEELTLLGAVWRVISTPGHTAGSCCYYLPEEGILFSGDTLFDGDCGRTDLPTGNSSAILHSIREILMKLPDETQVLPGHETFTTIGRERRQNIVMRMNWA